MSRKLTTVFGLMASALALAAATFTREVGHLRELAISIFTFGLGLFSPADQAARPVVSFVRAKQFVLRIAKRVRVLVSPSWRMCPST